MICLRDMTSPEMEELAKRLGQPAYRGRQLYKWISAGTKDFREITDLPGVFIRALSDECIIDPLEELEHQVSDIDGTEKFLFGLEEGPAVETVLMKYRYGYSVCVSSQAGCRMGCSFCASGIDGLERNLTAGEIMSQVFKAAESAGERIGHVVIMGTGEPFDNYENVSRFIELLHDEKGYDLGLRNITVSTCGLVPMIERLGKDFPQVNLAISLHSAVDETRSRIMPVNKSYPLSELLPAAFRHADETGRRVTFEYALMKGVNDSSEDISELSSALAGHLCHVNLIPLNEVSESGYSSSGRKRALEIAEILAGRGIAATVRRELGSDIDGACGQLRLRKRL